MKGAGGKWWPILDSCHHPGQCGWHMFVLAFDIGNNDDR